MELYLNAALFSNQGYIYKETYVQYILLCLLRGVAWL